VAYACTTRVRTRVRSGRTSVEVPDENREKSQCRVHRTTLCFAASGFFDPTTERGWRKVVRGVWSTRDDNVDDVDEDDDDDDDDNEDDREGLKGTSNGIVRVQTNTWNA
jgi:hypothetical protein